METITNSNFKNSKAITIWILISLSVMLLLFCLTRTKVYGGYNLFLNGKSEVIGAKVYIDNKYYGQLINKDESGLGGGSFWARIKNGHHFLQIIKTGYLSFSKPFNMNEEEYIGIELKPLKN